MSGDSGWGRFIPRLFQKSHSRLLRVMLSVDQMTALLERPQAGSDRHMKYIEKKGAPGLETDMGTRAGGEHFAHRMVSDWDLDIEALRRYEKRGTFTSCSAPPVIRVTPLTR